MNKHLTRHLTKAKEKYTKTVFQPEQNKKTYKKMVIKKLEIL